MKRIVSLLRYIPMWMLGVIILASCTKDPVSTNPNSGNTVSFRMLVPATVPVETRGTPGTIAENNILDITVLVFDEDDELVEIVPGENLQPKTGSGNENKQLWTFNANIPKGKYDLMAIANHSGLLAEIEEGDTKNEVAEAFIIENTDNWEVSASDEAIPMWGEINGKTISGSSTLEFHMIRMLARINVDASEVSECFELKNIRYYNGNTKGCVIPSSSNYMTDGSGKINILGPTVPDDAIMDDDNYYFYDNDYDYEYINEDDNTCIEEIYVFEAAHVAPYDEEGWKNNPCLIIGGKYKTPTPDEEEMTRSAGSSYTYYRLDFISNDGEGPDNWLDVLRNHSYNFTITAISGAGYENPYIALQSAPINIEAKLVELDDMEYVISDGRYYLAVSQYRYELDFQERTGKGSDNVLTVRTNCPGGWKAEFWNDLEGTISVEADPGSGLDWLYTNYNETSGGNGDEIGLYCDENKGNEERTAYIHITAGRLLKVIVEVKQMKNE